MWEWFEDSNTIGRLDSPLIDTWESKEGNLFWSFIFNLY